MGICVKCDRCATQFNGHYLESLQGATRGHAATADEISLMIAQAKALGWTGGLSGTSDDDLCPKCSKQLEAGLTLKFWSAGPNQLATNGYEYEIFKHKGKFIPLRNAKPLSEPVATLLEAKTLCEAVYELKQKGS